jgi:hypothetical protein
MQQFYHLSLLIHDCLPKRESQIDVALRACGNPFYAARPTAQAAQSLACRRRLIQRQRSEIGKDRKTLDIYAYFSRSISILDAGIERIKHLLNSCRTFDIL